MSSLVFLVFEILRVDKRPTPIYVYVSLLKRNAAVLTWKAENNALLAVERERRKKELADLYNKLEYLIIPNYYEHRDSWINMMRNSIGKVAYYFNTHRMMRRYATDAYL